MPLFCPFFYHGSQPTASRALPTKTILSMTAIAKSKGLQQERWQAAAVVAADRWEQGSARAGKWVPGQIQVYNAIEGTF